MPLPNDTNNVHESFNHGYCTFNEKSVVRNANRRVTGSQYKKIVSCRYKRANLTSADYEFLEVLKSKVTMKIEVPYNARIEMFTENKLVLDIRGIRYQLEKTDKFNNRLFCYLSTFDINAGKTEGDILK